MGNNHTNSHILFTNFIGMLALVDWWSVGVSKALIVAKGVSRIEFYVSSLICIDAVLGSIDTPEFSDWTRAWMTT